VNASGGEDRRSFPTRTRSGWAVDIMHLRFSGLVKCSWCAVVSEIMLMTPGFVEVESACSVAPGGRSIEFLWVVRVYMSGQVTTHG
jgi:hypothetical protein